MIRVIENSQYNCNLKDDGDKGLYLGIEVYIVTPALQLQAICLCFSGLARN
ncbi:hypothetical protein yfred0001_33280 [Yersinia frederiksenii ATCC 33641]|nr:hypothetical protein yfred0001_33280 [Yersinia frederiksenii ATCC 33641]